jgi:hypothetical protein
MAKKPTHIKHLVPAPNKKVAGLMHPVETVAVSSLTPHPKNYRAHPKAQLKHLCDSISQHGLYRNVVVAKDSTILAGHGVVEAVTQLGLKEIQVIRLNVSSESDLALKVLTGDNEISNLVDVDDHALLEVLKEIDASGNLLGTGFDTDKLDALLQATLPAEFAEDAWAGMPEYTNEDQEPHRQILVSFSSEEKVAEFVKLTKILVTPKTKSCWFPPEDSVSCTDHTYETSDISDNDDK